MKAFLILEDGTVFTGTSIGSTRDMISEIVFNTSMTGYLEVLTDPSYAGQAVTMTYPLIGNYGITPDMLSEVMREAGNPLLKQKLEDLELIYSGFRQYIEEHYITAEEILDILCRELPKWEILRDSVILLDGFTGFTPVQYRLVELFLLHARKVLCSVTIDPRANAYQEGSIQHLFYMGKHTVCRLDCMAKRHGIAKEPDVICSRRPAWRFVESPGPGFLGQELYRIYGTVWDRAADHVGI